MELTLLLVFGLFAYFLPSIIAGSRGHRNTASIVVLNIFLGWTFLGWVIGLVWSFSDNVEQPARATYLSGEYAVAGNGSSRSGGHIWFALGLFVLALPVFLALLFAFGG